MTNVKFERKDCGLRERGLGILLQRFLAELLEILHGPFQIRCYAPFGRI